MLLGHFGLIQRAFIGFLLSFILTIGIMPFFISIMHRYAIQPLRDFLHHDDVKNGVPTMGGFVIIAVIIMTSILATDLSSYYIRISLLTLILFGAIGFLDDKVKLSIGYDGLSIIRKFILQLLAAIAVLLLIYIYDDKDNILFVPIWRFSCASFVLLSVIRLLTLVGTSNAVNISDGMDTIATFSLIIAFCIIAIISILSDHYISAFHYSLYMMHGTSELFALCMITIGSLLGFLWFNSQPATVFIGDVGSLGLGALLGVSAILLKSELLLILIGGLFVIQAMSVILQYTSKKIFGVKMILMSPLHHHLQMIGWQESKIITRFIMIALLFAFISLFIILLP